MGVTFAPPGHRITLDGQGSLSMRRRRELGFEDGGKIDNYVELDACSLGVRVYVQRLALFENRVLRGCCEENHSCSGASLSSILGL